MINLTLNGIQQQIAGAKSVEIFADMEQEVITEACGEREFSLPDGLVLNVESDLVVSMKLALRDLEEEPDRGCFFDVIIDGSTDKPDFWEGFVNAMSQLERMAPYLLELSVICVLSHWGDGRHIGLEIDLVDENGLEMAVVN